MRDRIKEHIKEYIVENFLYGEPEDLLSDDLSFVDSGIMDSSRVLSLILYIEEAYCVYFEDDDVVPENLGSVNAIASFVRQKMRLAA